MTRGPPAGILLGTVLHQDLSNFVSDAVLFYLQRRELLWWYSMNSQTYFGTLCDFELENVAAHLSMYPYCERWGRDIVFDGIKKCIEKDNPLRRACGSLLRHESTRSFPNSTLLASADLLEHINFEPWNVEEFEDEQLIQPFLNECTSLTSVRLKSLGPLDFIQVWCKRLMETIGKQLTSISVCNQTWVLRHIEVPCVNLRKLVLTCAPAEALYSEFWEKAGPRLRELEMVFRWSYDDDDAVYVAQVRQITQFVRDYCRGLSVLDLEGQDNCNQILAECIASFPQLDVTRIVIFAVEQAKLIAESCTKVRVHLTLTHEPTAHEIIQCFGDRIDELSVSDMMVGEDDIEIHNAELEAALNNCSTIKKYSCNTLSLMSYLCAKPKHELIGFTMDVLGEKILASHLVALTKSTGHLRKIQIDNITSMLPSGLWKEVFTANSHLEEVDLSFYIARDFDADVDHDESRNEQEFRLTQMWKHLPELLKQILPLQNLRFVKLLHLNFATPSRNEIRNLENACVPFRHRKVHVDVNGIVILPIGYATIH